jgi:hypothetical protein
MRADEDRQTLVDERSEIAEDSSEFRAMMHNSAASAPSGWRSILFTIAAWSLAGWALIAAVWWVGSSVKIDLFSAKKPSARYQSR